MKNIFLQAEWRKLIMANYKVDPDLLKNYIPNKTELDLWNNTCYISLVGFMFLNTKIKGFKIPFHSDFEEVNLRFYVRYNENGNWKRGVVFIKEIVPKHALTFVANLVYGENYETKPMKHFRVEGNNKQVIEYKWRNRAKWNSIKVETDLGLYEINEGSEEEFITEHYRGYAKINDRKTTEYEVGHPRWQVFKTLDYKIDVNFGETYGQSFEFLNNSKPISVFLAEGSLIEVKDGKTI